jgi:hypothetical protein
MKEERETMEREISDTYETHSRVVFQQRENFDFETPDSPATERERTESQLTQPPTYEEAMEMLSASREDIVSRAGAESSGDNEQEINDRENEHSEDYSVSSDESGDEQSASKTLNNRNKLRRNSP